MIIVTLIPPPTEDERTELKKRVAVLESPVQVQQNDINIKPNFIIEKNCNTNKIIDELRQKTNL